MKKVRLAEIPSGENGNVKTIGLLAEGEELPRPPPATLSSPRLHYCPYCAFTTSITARLTEHLRIHAVKKPFPCPHCSFQAVQVESIRAHIRTHTGEKPFACAHCPYRSTQKGNMKRHIIKHHFVVAFAK
ncbi:zinc finger protein 513-like [Scylla paramamosain]